MLKPIVKFRMSLARKYMNSAIFIRNIYNNTFPEIYFCSNSFKRHLFPAIFTMLWQWNNAFDEAVIESYCIYFKFDIKRYTENYYCSTSYSEWNTSFCIKSLIRLVPFETRTRLSKQAVKRSKKSALLPTWPLLQFLWHCYKAQNTKVCCTSNKDIPTIISIYLYTRVW